MKCLVFLAAVLAVAAGQVWTPTVGVDKMCMMCGDPVIRSTSGRYFYIAQNTKTKLIEHKEKEKDRSKFQVHCVTAVTYFRDGDSAPAWVDWCGVSFWTHSAIHKFMRSYVFGQYLHCVGVRGQGYQGPSCQCFDEESPGVYTVHTFPHESDGDLSGWNPAILRPEPEGCTPYYITRDATKLIFTSDEQCGYGWAVHFYPSGRDTCVNIFVRAGEAADRVRQTDGMCGMMTGNPADDVRKCKDPVTYQWAPADPNLTDDEIANSCQDSTHTGIGYVGGMKIFSVCNILNPV